MTMFRTQDCREVSNPCAVSRGQGEPPEECFYYNCLLAAALSLKHSWSPTCSTALKALTALIQARTGPLLSVAPRPYSFPLKMIEENFRLVLPS